MASVRQLSPDGARNHEIDFSVIVCSFTMERWEALSAAVASVREQTLQAREIIVVIDDNEQLERRAREEFDGVIVVANRHSPGSCGGRQTGGELAGGSILAFLDDDAIADPDWLEHLAAAYADPNVLGVGGLVEPGWLGPPPRWLPPELNWTVGCSYAGLPEQTGRIRNPIGANMSMRADVLERTGGFELQMSRTNDGWGTPTSVSCSCEEAEFAIRASGRHPGGYWVHEPRARVVHAVPPSRTTWRYFIRRCRLEGTAKAVLTGIAGRSEGLRDERQYTRVVLPRALARELGSALRGRRDGILRAAAIVGGLLFTAIAYVQGRTRAQFRAAPRGSVPTESTPYQGTPAPGAMASKDPHQSRHLRAPVAVRMIDVDDPRDLELARDGAPYRSALLVAIEGGSPVGEIALAIDGLDRIPSERLRALIEQRGFSASAGRPVPGALPPVSVVVATCAQPDAVLATVASALACEPPPHEVIVVENRPERSPVSDALAARFGADPRVRYVEEHRVGLAAARNAGLRIATGKIVAFTDDDVAIDHAWVGAIARAFATEPDAACVTGLILPGDLLTREQVLLQQFASFGKGYERRVHRLDAPDSPMHPFAAGHFGSGASTALRVDLARSLDGFDAAFSTGTATRGAEDLDMYIRVLLAGYALVYEPAAIVWHQHPDQPHELRRRLFDYGVGLTAMFTKYAVSGCAGSVLRRLPAAVRYYFDSKSRKNVGKGPEYPRALDWIERAGLAIGPAAYGVSKLRERRAGYAATGVLPNRRKRT